MKKFSQKVIQTKFFDRQRETEFKLNFHLIFRIKLCIKGGNKLINSLFTIYQELEIYKLIITEFK
jgi:hypothetical protein